MDNYITVTAEDGKKYKAEVIDIFNVEEYQDKDYIIYSFGEEVDNENEKVYVSIVEKTNDEYFLKGIDDPKEWEVVQNKINEMNENNGEDYE